MFTRNPKGRDKLTNKSGATANYTNFICTNVFNYSLKRRKHGYGIYGVSVRPKIPLHCLGPIMFDRPYRVQPS